MYMIAWFQYGWQGVLSKYLVQLFCEFYPDIMNKLRRVIEIINAN